MTSVHRQLIPITRWLASSDVLAPVAIEAKVRQLVLDTLGCALAALAAPPVAQFALEQSALGAGAIRLGGDLMLHPLAAAQTLAIAATWDEACEGLARAHGRPGVPVVAALIALAVARTTSLGALLSSVAAGYEIGARMGEWLRNKPGMHVDAGWPALGVAAGAARLLGGSAEDMLNAIETAACQLAIGLYAPVKAGATARNTYLAHASALGLLAAMATRSGMDAPTTGLRDHAAIALGRDDPPPHLAPAGEWLLGEGYLKPFAAVRHVHYGAAAALALRPALYARLDRIRRIELTVYPEALEYCGNRAPLTPIAAQFSLSFGLAAALRFGDLSPAVYRAGQFNEPGLRRLEQLIEIRADPELARSFGRAAHLRVHLAGESLEHTATGIKGDAAEPFTSADCHEKFLSYAVPTIRRNAVEQFAAALLAGPLDQSVADLWNSLWS